MEPGSPKPEALAVMTILRAGLCFRVHGVRKFMGTRAVANRLGRKPREIVPLLQDMLLAGHIVITGSRVGMDCGYSLADEWIDTKECK